MDIYLYMFMLQTLFCGLATLEEQTANQTISDRSVPAFIEFTPTSMRAVENTTERENRTVGTDYMPTGTTAHPTDSASPKQKSRGKNRNNRGCVDNYNRGNRKQIKKGFRMPCAIIQSVSDMHVLCGRFYPKDEKALVCCHEHGVNCSCLSMCHSDPERLKFDGDQLCYFRYNHIIEACKKGDDPAARTQKPFWQHQRESDPQGKSSDSKRKYVAFYTNNSVTSYFDVMLLVLVIMTSIPHW